MSRSLKRRAEWMREKRRASGDAPKLRWHMRVYGDSELDAKRTLGLQSEAASLLPGLCRTCHGLAHRRAQRGACPGCGGRYQAEQIGPLEPQGFSSIALFAASW